MGMMHGRKTVGASHAPVSSGIAGLLAGRCFPRFDSRAGKDAGDPGIQGHDADQQGTDDYEGIAPVSLLLKKPQFF
jgi:hypothetical protein